MSEKKYYVKLSPEVMYYSDYGLLSIQYLEPYLNDSGDFAPATDRASFTKSEIARIMGGAIYKKEITDVYDAQTEQMGFPEWINPLIELVPVEDGE